MYATMLSDDPASVSLPDGNARPCCNLLDVYTVAFPYWAPLFWAVEGHLRTRYRMPITCKGHD